MPSKAEQCWEGIRRSPLWSVYVSEAHLLAKRISVELDEIFSSPLLVTEPNRPALTVAPEVHDRIINVVFAAGRLRALLRDRQGPRTGMARDILALRAKALRELLDGISLEPLMDAMTRDAIEHFDEHFDSDAIASYQGTIGRPTLFALDLAVSSRSALDGLTVVGTRPTLHFLRVYVVDERMVIHRDYELRLTPLRTCCEEIRARIEEQSPTLAAPDRGASLVVITDSSFPLA